MSIRHASKPLPAPILSYCHFVILSFYSIGTNNNEILLQIPSCFIKLLLLIYHLQSSSHFSRLQWTTHIDVKLWRLYPLSIGFNQFRKLPDQGLNPLFHYVYTCTMTFRNNSFGDSNFLVYASLQHEYQPELYTFLYARCRSFVIAFLVPFSCIINSVAVSQLEKWLFVSLHRKCIFNLKHCTNCL